MTPTSDTQIFAQACILLGGMVLIVSAAPVLIRRPTKEQLILMSVFALVVMAAVGLNTHESDRLMKSQAKPVAILYVANQVKGLPEDKLLAELLLEDEYPTYRALEKVMHAKRDRDAREAEGNAKLAKLRERAKKVIAGESNPDGNEFR